MGTGRGHYGQISLGGRRRQAHRVAYEWLVGPIPDGLVLDHLCRVTTCVNPAHLEAVDNRTNVVLRTHLGWMAQRYHATECVNGHEWTEENTRWRKDGTHPTRICRTCHRERERRYAQRSAR